jgi:threonine dehydrogenase-like Zn-dependent dehydrogenase
MAGRLNPEPLYSHRFPLTHIADAFRILDSREGSFTKTLITYV